MAVPSVRVRAPGPPPGWSDASAEVTQPPVGSGTGSTFTQWYAARSPSGTEALLLGCVATPIPGWVDDMRPTVDYRTVSLMSASAERIVGVPVGARDEDGHFGLRPVGAPDEAAPVGIARTFVGWDEHAVVTCFVACARPATGQAAAKTGGERPRACDSNVLGAVLDGGGPPPPAGLVLGAVTWAVHHPSAAVTWAGVLVFALGATAVALRRRQRSRI